MADGESLGSLLVEIGIEASGFKGQMQEISRRMGLAKSEFIAAGGAVKGFEDTTQGAAAKAKMLTDQIELQKAKLGVLENEYDQAAQGLGKNSKEAQDLMIKLNSARGAMASMENELKQTTDAANDTALKVNKLGDEAAKTERKTKDLHGSMGGLSTGLKSMASGAAQAAVAAIAAVAAAAGIAITAAIGLGKAALEQADNIQKLADVSGRTAEQIQIMAYQEKNLGVEEGTLVGAQGKLTKSMDTARDQLLKYNAGMKEHNKDHKKAIPVLGDAAAAYKALKVNAIDPATGALRNSKTVMEEALKALAGVANETERDQLAMTLFGKSAMELNPIIKAGGAELQRLADEAVRTGAVMSGDAVKGLDSFGDSIGNLKSSITGIAGTLLSTFQLQIDSTMGMLKNLGIIAADAAKSGDWSLFAAQASFAMTSLAEQFVKMLPGFITIGTQILTTLIKSLVTSVPVILPQLATAIVTLITAITGILATQGPALITAAIGALGTLVTGLLSALPMVMQASMQIIIALVQGLAAQVPTLIPAAVECVLTLVQTLVDNLPMLIDAAILLILALVDGVITAIPKIIQAAPKIVIALVNGIVQAIPKLLDAALKIIVALINFLPEYFPMLIEAMPQILTAIVTGLIQSVGAIWKFMPVLLTEVWNAIKSIDWGKLGKSMLDGIVKGLSNGASAIWNALKSAVMGAVNSFKDFFGIHSPSTFMENQIGFNLGGGVARGITGSAGLVGRAMMGLQSQLNLGAMNLSLNPALAGGPGGGYGGGSVQTERITHNSVPIVININGNIANKDDAEYMAQRLQSLVNGRLRAGGIA